MKSIRSRITSALFCGLATIVALVVPTLAQDSLKPTMKEEASFDVIGIQTRTSNAAEMSGSGEIPKLWQRLFMEGILNSIPDRVDDGIAVVYTKYESGATGQYTYILGAKVKPGTKAPEGMVAVTVPAGKYAQFVTAKGPGGEVVPAAWKAIYAYFAAPGAPARAFQFDYEIYPDLSNPNEMQANMFIGVKP